MFSITSATRIGALLPATNPVVEPDFYRVIPAQVTVHFERMWNGRWAGKPGIQDDEEYRVNMGSKEADEVDWVLLGFDATKMNEDGVRGARSRPGYLRRWWGCCWRDQQVCDQQAGGLQAPGRPFAIRLSPTFLLDRSGNPPKKGSWIGAFALKVKIDQPLV